MVEKDSDPRQCRVGIAGHSVVDIERREKGMKMLSKVDCCIPVLEQLNELQGSDKKSEASCCFFLNNKHLEEISSLP